MKRLIGTMLSAVLFSMTAVGAVKTSPLKISEASRKAAENTMQVMTMRQRVAQLIMPDLKMFDMEEARKLIDTYVGDDEVGGLLFYKGECEDQIELYNRAVEQSKLPLLVAIDGEWGLSMRLSRTPRFPVNMALGAISDPNLLFEYGYEMGRQCRRMGISINFAPVVDVNSNPENPVIGRRAYSDDKEIVASHGVNYSLGLESAGVISCVKHFPGHGDTNQDSHKTLPTINRSKETIYDVDLYPFRKYVESGCNGAMVAHLNIPSLDTVTGLCSSLSPVIVDGILRKEMGFEGLIFTDALVMEGVAHYENNAVKALLAGNDVVLMPNGVENTIDDILKALERGEITEECINEHCAKILAYKYELKLTLDPIEPENILADLNSKECDNLIYKLAKASVTLVSDKPGMVGKIKAKKTQLVALGDDENLRYRSLGDTVITTREFYRYIDKSFKNVISYNSKSTEMPVVDANKPMVVEVFSAKPKYIEAVKQLSVHKNAVFVFYVNPYEMMRFSESLNMSENTVVCAYEDTYHAQKVAQEGLMGKLKFVGKMPIKLEM